MAVPIAVAIRQQVVERRLGGQNLGEVARALNIPYESARTVWKLYQKEGRIRPAYENCGPQGPKASKRVYRAALFLKHLHPTWGAPLIRHLIQEKWKEEKVPSERSIQRWFKQAGINRPRKKPMGDARKGRGKIPHNVWEMDSREEISLANGQKVVWLVVSDETSGAILNGSVFPPRQSQPTQC